MSGFDYLVDSIRKTPMEDDYQRRAFSVALAANVVSKLPVTIPLGDKLVEAVQKAIVPIAKTIENYIQYGVKE